MHWVSPALRRWSSAILWSMRFDHSPRQTRPVPARGDAVGRELLQLGADLVERQADPLGEHDEGDPAQRRAGEAAMPGARALGRYEAALLVEAQRRRGDPAAPGDLADGQHGLHDEDKHDPALDFKLT